VLKPVYGMGYGNAAAVNYRPGIFLREGTYTTDAKAALKKSSPVDGRRTTAGEGYIF